MSSPPAEEAHGSGIERFDDAWCTVCGTRHKNKADCPGQLLATGAERHARRITVAAGARNESYGVLIADCEGQWRARILTFPNMLWCVPAGRGTMKFLGKSPQDAEQQAMAYIEAHCKARGYKFVGAAEKVESGTVDREYALKRRAVGAKEERHLREIPVMFGPDKADQPATTSDMSAGGLFIATTRPLSKGRPLTLRLDLGGFSVPLKGTIAWTRSKSEPGRPAGMGVQLINPSAMYVRYVRELERHEAEGPPAPAE